MNTVGTDTKGAECTIIKLVHIEVSVQNLILHPEIADPRIFLGGGLP
jgi:hypothetical protein